MRVDWLFANGEIAVRHRPAGDAMRHVVTFDHYHDHPGFDRPAFAEDFLQQRGIAATHVLTRDNRWFQYAEIDAILAAVRGTVREGANVLAYGSSMGGYAALRFADAVGAQRVLALSPQYSVDPRVVPEDRRWRSAQRRIRFRPELNGRIACAAEVTILYDPHGLDGLHVARVAADVPVRRVRVRHAGHPVGTFLGEIGQLADIMLAGARGVPGAAQVEAVCRAARAGLDGLCLDPRPGAARLAAAAGAGAGGAGRGAAAGLRGRHNVLALRLRALGRS
jgi:hypothetical protein